MLLYFVLIGWGKWGRFRGGVSLRRLRAHQIGQRRDALGGPVEAEAIAEIGKEGDAELLAGLHQPEHDIAGLAAIGAHRAARDPALGYAGPLI
jgi:hypothetical protein